MEIEMDSISIYEFLSIIKINKRHKLIIISIIISLDMNFQNL